MLWGIVDMYCMSAHWQPHTPMTRTIFLSARSTLHFSSAVSPPERPLCSSPTVFHQCQGSKSNVFAKRKKMASRAHSYFSSSALARPARGTSILEILCKHGVTLSVCRLQPKRRGISPNAARRFFAREGLCIVQWHSDTKAIRACHLGQGMQTSL